jgi:hypothetical protein
MSAIIKFAEPAELYFQSARSTNRMALREAQPMQWTSMHEPERRLWKLTTQAVSPSVARFESFLLVLQLFIALVVMSSCFIQSSHLLQSDAIQHIVTKAILAAG